MDCKLMRAQKGGADLFLKSRLGCLGIGRGIEWKKGKIY